VGEVVLGIGTSHSPMLNATAEEWARFAPRDRTLQLFDRNGERTGYDALLAQAGGRLNGECTPTRFAERLRTAHSALDRLSGEIGHARLDALLVIGDDQKELFLDDCIPALAVYYGNTIAHQMRPPKPDWPDWFAAIQSRYYVGPGRAEYPVDAGLARHLAAHLVANGFDAAASDRLPRGEGEGHAFAFVHRRLLRDEAKLAFVPVFLNTYYPPNQPTPARCQAIGRAIRAAVESWPAPARVGVLASGGLSHFAIDEPFDRAIIAAMRGKDAGSLASLPEKKLNSGNSEIRNWIAAAGALEHLPLAWVEYVPAYRSPAGTGTGLCFAAWRA
jgi:Catalytic LigB subunit of aromatic ring-opening dioxygenase